MNLAQIRAKYPQYGDLSDKQLADALHKKFYSDLPIEDYYKRIGFAAAPPESAAVSKIKGLFPAPVADVLHQFADVPIGFQKGVLQGIRMVSDIFGANNAFSKSVKQNEEALANLMSAQSRGDQQEIARILKEAEDKGVLDQIKAGVKAFTVAPVDTLTSALGTAAPAIVAALGAKVLGAGALLTTGVSVATGAGMGAGTIKGTIYEETKKALQEAGVPESVAEERAQKAQEYGGQNLDQILAGAVIGGVAAKGPLEKGAVRAIANRISKNVAAREAAESVSEGAAKSAATGRIRAGVAEALPEAGQAAQEQIAANIAQQREGLDVPTFRGAFSAATMEGIAGGGLGAAFGGGRPPVEQPAADAVPGETPIERAERLAAEKAAAVPPAEPAPPPEDEEPKVRKPGEPAPLPDVLDDATIKTIGFPKGKIHDALLGKSLTDPEIRTVLEEYKQRPTASAKTAAKIDAFLARLPEPVAPVAPPVEAPPAPAAEAAPVAPPPEVETPAVPPAEAPVGEAPTPPAAAPVTEAPSARPIEPEAGGAGVPVAGGPVAVAPTEGVGAPEPSGVVPPVADVERPVGGEGPAPVAVGEVSVSNIYNKYTNEKGITAADKVAEEIVGVVDTALKNNQPVSLVIEGKTRPIVSIDRGMMQDDKGQRWGTLILMRDRSTPGGARLEVGPPPQPAPTPPVVETRVETPPTPAVPPAPAPVVEAPTPAPAVEAVTPPAPIAHGEYEPPVKAGLAPKRETELRAKLAQQRKELSILEAARDKAEGNIYLAEITGDEEAKARAIDAHEAARLVLKKAVSAADRTYAQIFDMEKADFEGSVGEAYIADIRAERDAEAKAAGSRERQGLYPYNLKTADAVSNELREQASHLPGYKELIEKYFTPTRQLREGRTEEEFVAEGQKFLDTSVLYQIRETPGISGNKKADVERIARAVVKDWENAPEIEVVQSETDLPQPIQDQIKRDNVSGRVPGLYNNGKVWLIADSSDSRDAIFKTIAHEATGHHGLRGVLGEQFNPTMLRIYRTNPAVQRKAAEKRAANSNLSVETAVEEVLADAQEIPRKDRPWWKKALDTIRIALQRVFKGEKFSDAQVEDLLRASRKWVRQGKRPARMEGTAGAAFRITPETEKAVEDVDVIGEKEKQTTTQRVKETLKKNPALAARVKLTDSMAAIEDFFVNAYGGQIRTAQGRLNPMVLLSRALDSARVSKAAQEQGGLGFEDGLIVAKDMPVSYKGVLERIATAAKERGETYESFRKKIDTVLYAHREHGLREMNKTLPKNEQVTLLLPDAKIDELEAAFQKDDFIKQVSADLDTIRFNLLDTLVEAGRISKEQAQDYKDATGYIPFNRLGDYEQAYQSAKGRNRGVAALRNLRKLEGSERQTTSPIENFSGLMDWATKEAMKNDAALRALKDMTLMGAAFKRPNKPKKDAPGDVVTVYDEGKPVSYYVPDPAHFIAFSIQDPQLSSVMRGLQRGSQILRAGVTTMPPFAIKQVFDDIVRAYAYAGVKNNAALVKSVMLNFPKNWVNEIFRKKPADIKRLESLGIVGTFDFSQQSNLKNILEEAGAKEEGLGSKIIRVMEAGAKASDLAVRKAVYDQVLKETGDVAQAESAAREIINFSRRGSAKFMGTMISVVPFFNAYARGMDKLATAAAGKQVGQTTGTARAMFYKRMGVLTAMGLAYALMMQDDEEYQNLPDHVRDTNWVLPYGKALGFTPVIPVPAELAFFFKAIPERVLRYYKLYGTDEEQAAIDVLGEMTKRGIDVFSSPNVTPQLLRPFVENLVNHSWFLGRPLESQAQLQLRPFERYGTGTSDAMKAVAKGLEDVANATGMEAFAISPIKLENAIRGIFGTAAGLGLSVADMAINPGRTDRPIHQQLGTQLTGLSAVAKDPIGTRQLDAIYDLEKKVEQINGTYNRLIERKPEDVDQFIRDNIGLYSVRGPVQAVMEGIRSLNQAATMIDRDTSLKPEERRQQIDELRVEQNKLAMEAMRLRKLARDIQAGK